MAQVGPTRSLTGSATDEPAGWPSAKTGRGRAVAPFASYNGYARDNVSLSCDAARAAAARRMRADRKHVETHVMFQHETPKKQLKHKHSFKFVREGQKLGRVWRDTVTPRAL